MANKKDYVERGIFANSFLPFKQRIFIKKKMWKPLGLQPHRLHDRENNFFKMLLVTPFQTWWRVIYLDSIFVLI
ncbi:hypothetical protein CISIN_1g047589mg [Citrus sinensis]|uniref:Uncharacterized protein n=1 Tax=Citrus sinensis TaxID=2711 RepID=A0A067DDV7_CITSI|nr:hypothetical protein CISIN_1g047589mg [Citrus sinensis]